MTTPPPLRRGTVGDALAAAARAKPAPPAAKRWLWMILISVVGVICLLQILGILKSPVGERVRELHEEREKANPTAGMSSDPAPAPGPTGR